MLQVRSKRVTAGLYLCEYTEITKQLYQHAGLLSLYLSDLRVVRHSHSRMPLRLHHLVERLSQHADLILKWWTDDAYRCRAGLNRCQTFICGQDRDDLSIYMPVSTLKTLHCDTHLFQGICEKPDIFLLFSSSTLYFISPAVLIYFICATRGEVDGKITKTYATYMVSSSECGVWL